MITSYNIASHHTIITLHHYHNITSHYTTITLYNIASHYTIITPYNITWHYTIIVLTIITLHHYRINHYHITPLSHSTIVTLHHYHIMPQRMTERHITPHYITLHHYHSRPQCMAECLITQHCITLHHNASNNVTPHCIKQHYTTHRIMSHSLCTGERRCSTTSIGNHVTFISYCSRTGAKKMKIFYHYNRKYCYLQYFTIQEHVPKSMFYHETWK